ncbi:MAG: hypothetical protein SVV67_03565 [Bacillota bacterium]|nr:hypothetical protein [Bacillota bacterium]
MPGFKTLLIATLTAVLLLSSAGCDILSGNSADPTDENSGQNSVLPEWLLLAHRNAEDPDADDNEIALNLKERDDENDDTEEEGLLETAQPETTESSQPEAVEHSLEDPAPSSPAPSQSNSSSESSTEGIPEPGTKERLKWLMKQADDNFLNNDDEQEDDGEQDNNDGQDWWGN